MLIYLFFVYGHKCVYEHIQYMYNYDIYNVLVYKYVVYVTRV